MKSPRRIIRYFHCSKVDTSMRKIYGHKSILLLTLMSARCALPTNPRRYSGSISDSKKCRNPTVEVYSAVNRKSWMQTKYIMNINQKPIFIDNLSSAMHALHEIMKYRAITNNFIDCSSCPFKSILYVNTEYFPQVEILKTLNFYNITKMAACSATNREHRLIWRFFLTFWKK